MNYYIIKNRKMPWGDYGNILFSGLLIVMDNDYNPIDVHLIERTGPYIPEIYTTISENIVIREDIKNLLLKHNITGIKKIHNTKIKKLVKIDWQKWDFDADPKEYPAGGEPYNYISTRKHSEMLYANEKSNYYSLSFKEDCELKRVGDTFFLKGEPLFDIFQPTNMGYIIVSQKFKEIIENNTDNCLRFISLQNPAVQNI